MRVSARNGFTLLELSIVLVIVAILTGMSAAMGISVLATARLSATNQRMAGIEQALMKFRSANNRLPCPADLTIPQGSANYGLEGATPGACTGGTPAANFHAAGVTNTTATAAEGAVPVVTLGLPNDFMVDGWGNRFRYAVDISMTALGAFSNSSLCSVSGAITVNDASASARTTGAIYALISHGANGHGAYTQKGAILNANSVNANEQTNCHCNSSGAATTYAPTYVQAVSSADSSNALDNFDDLVTYKERWQVRTDWDAACTSKYIYVADQGGYRVEIFNTSGTYISQIGACSSGACSSGTANGAFNFPNGIAIDSSGNVWVTDYNNNRVQKFNSSGTFLMGIGAGYQGVGGSVGQYGTTNGWFTYPGGIAIDSSGNAWVTDFNNNRVEKFNSSGTFLLGIGAGYQGVGGTIGSSGTGHGKFNGPTDVHLDSSGNVWVLDAGNYLMQKFNASGTYQSQWTPGARNQFNIDASNNFWITDFSTDVYVYNSSGTYLGQLSGGPGFRNSNFVAFDSSGNIYVTDYGGNNVQEFNSSGTFVMQGGSPGTGNLQFQGINGMAIGSR